MGCVVNPKLAHSQAIGGMVGSIGMALLAETEWDETLGRVANGTIAEYLVPVNALFVEGDDRLFSPLGTKGAAELGLCGVRLRSRTRFGTRPASASATCRSPLTACPWREGEFLQCPHACPIAPDHLTPEQRALYQRTRQQIAGGFSSFKTMREDGALLGPWGLFLHEPAVGQAHYDQIAAVTALNVCQSPSSRSRFSWWERSKAAYELYAHATTAASEGMAAAKIATIVAGQPPADLAYEEAIAYEVASSLAADRVLADSTIAPRSTRLARAASMS